MKRLSGFMSMLLCAGSAIAVQVLYTAEGDSSGATDKLTADGAQDGAFMHTFSNDTKSATSDVFVGATAKNGDSAFGFNQTASYINAIDLPDVTSLGSAFTLAAFVRPTVTANAMRFFSTFNGTGGIANQLLCDYGSSVNGFRLCINGVIIKASPAVTIPVNSFSHLAATYDDGEVRLYMNGTEVGRGTAGSGIPVINYNDDRRLQVGEDWHWPPTAGNTGQSVGYMDEILIYDRALSSNEVAQLSVSKSTLEFLSQDGILYTAEGDTAYATDRLAPTLSQNGVFGTAGVTVQTDSPKFGTCAFNFTNPDGSDAERDVIRLSDSKCLGKKFTLAAYVDTATNTTQRLFTNWTTGDIGVDQLLFDLVPSSGDIFKMRLYCNLTGFTNGVQGTVSFEDHGYHHLAATYDDGEVRLYQDGVLVGAGTNGSGAVSLTKDLQFGVGLNVDSNRTAQFIGDVDDILFYTNALSVGSIRQLVYTGAEAFVSGTLLRPGVVYTAEGDSVYATDWLLSDGAQNGVFGTTGVTVRAGSAKFGRRAFHFANVDTNQTERDTLVIPDTACLGDRFTLAAYADVTNTTLLRLFSNYLSGYARCLLFDIDRSGAFGFNLRFAYDSSVVTVTTSLSSGWHHYAATFDRGDVHIYLDGVQVAHGSLPACFVSSEYGLRIGNDVLSGNDAQLLGDVDDVVILFESLDAGDVLSLATMGAEQFLGLEPNWPKGTVLRVF